MAANANVNTDEGLKEKLNEHLSFLPERLLRRLMTFQKEGVLFALKKDGRCLIGDEMGLGKTLQALSIAYYYRDKWPLLIVVPSSLRYPWIDEVERWFPEIDPAHINLIQAGTDTAIDRTAVAPGGPRGVSGRTVGAPGGSRDTVPTGVLVLSHGLPADGLGVVRMVSEQTRALGTAGENLPAFKVVIADESHSLKNRRSATSKYLVPLVQQSEHRILLTGTPALARPEELFPQVDSICPGEFGTWSAYAKRFCDARWQFFGRQRKKWVTDGACNLEELQYLLRDKCMIRRLKKDVLTQLPPKQRQRIMFPLKESLVKKDLDLSWRELETAMGRGSVTLGSVLAGQQPEEDTMGSTFDIHRLISTIYRKTSTVKIGPVKDYVKMLCDNQGLKFIVFAHHHVMMDGIAELLHDENVPYIRIDGNTDQQARPQLVHEFQANKKIRVALLSIKAAGVGLTLTAAKLVVFAELDWTPGTLEQCEDRAHRIGQKETVHVHYLLAKGTLDEWVWSALARKTAVVTTTLNGKRQTLKMDEGNQGQVACLANADAWVPKAKTDDDEQSLASFFESQQTKKQRNLHDFFTPKGRKRKKADGEDEEDSVEEQSPSKSAQKKRRETPTTSDAGRSGSPTVILIDSDDEDDKNFSTPKSSLVRGSLRQTDNSPICTPKSEKGGKLQKKRLLQVGNRMEDTPEQKPETSSNPDPDDQWSCEACTFLNHQALRACEICFTPKKKAKNIKTKEPTLDLQSLEAANTSKGGVSGRTNVGENRMNSDLEAQSLCDSTKRAMIQDGMLADEGDADCGDFEIYDFDEDPGTPPRHAKNKKNSDERIHSYNSPKSLPSPMGSPPEGCTLDSTLSEIEEEEAVAAELLFSQEEGEQTQPGEGWRCARCGMVNRLVDFLCDGCLSDRPPQNPQDKEESTNKAPAGPDVRNVDLDQVMVYDRFQYSCSRNTSRIYLYDEFGVSLDVNFIPLDVEMENFAALPDLLLHPKNLRIVKRFLREWTSLAPTKRRVVVKSGNIFANPMMHYEDLKKGRVSSKQRFTSKADVAAAAVSQAELVSGSVRSVTRPGAAHHPPTQTDVSPVRGKGALTGGKKTPSGGRGVSVGQKKGPATSPSRGGKKRGKSNKEPSSATNGDSVGISVLGTEEEIEKTPGMIQALAADGTPLCLNCQKPYKNDLVSEATIQRNKWGTRFCSYRCADDLWIRRHGAYARQALFELERGVCQLCKFDTLKVFEHMKVTKDVMRRAELLQQSKYSVLSAETKRQMASAPKMGQFWHADHIQAVYEGGGECDLDNLRTLCTPCHRQVTASQNQQRAAQRRKTPSTRDIKDFFKPSL